MRKFNASLLLVAACTGLFLAGCNQQSASQPAATTDSATGSIKIVTPPVTQNATDATTTIDSAKITTPGTSLSTDATTAVDAKAKADQALKDAEAAAASFGAATSGGNGN